MSKKLLIIGIIIICGSIIMGFSSIVNQDSDTKESEKNKIEMKKEEPVDSSKTTVEDKKFYLEGYDNSQNIFTNYVDGYSLIIPKNLEIDMTYPEIRTVLKNDQWRIEIYKEVLKQDVTADTYMNYSNQFLENTIDHKKEFEGNLKIGGWDSHVVQWSRKKLSKIKHDKNYYASVDLKLGKNQVCTFFFKSETPFENKSQYLNIVKSLSIKQPIDDTASLEGKTDKVQETDKENNEKDSKVADKKTYTADRNRIKHWDKATGTIFKRYFSGSSKLTWGIFEPSAPENFTNLFNIEKKLGYEFPFLVSYQHFSKEADQSTLRNSLINAKKEGRIIELSLQTTAQDRREGNMVYDILDGKYDVFLDSFIEEIKEAKTPILMRFCNEMNGDWCQYSSFHTSKDTELFKELYQYVYDRFEEKGAGQYAIWVWNPNERSLPEFKWNDELMYYPGDSYVDVVGLTGYNTGTYYEAEKWRSFHDIYAVPYNRAIKNYDKPLMITEFASSSVGGNKEEWIREMFQQIKKYPEIKVAIWWSGRDLDANGNVARPYWIDETNGTMEVFKENLQKVN